MNNNKNTEKLKRNHYQTESSYKLDSDLYRIIIYTIRYVYKTVKTRPKGNEVNRDYGEAIANPTENTAIHNVSDDDIIIACDEAWINVPREYQDAVYNHIVNDERYYNMDAAHENTYKKYVARYVWFVARNLGRV